MLCALKGAGWKDAHMGLPAFKQDFERLIADASAPQNSSPRSEVVADDNSLDDRARRILAGIEDFNATMNGWRDHTEASILAVRQLLSRFSLDEEYPQISRFVASVGLPKLLAGIDNAIAMLDHERVEYEARELPLRRLGARNPQVKKLANEIVLRQQVVLGKHLKSAGELRGMTMLLIWEHDPDTREVTGVFTSDEDIDGYFDSLN
jgi:hypothetical protein